MRIRHENDSLVEIDGLSEALQENPVVLRKSKELVALHAIRGNESIDCP